MEKVSVNENCIGCGYCVSSCPKYFAFNDEGYSSVVKEEVAKEDLDEVKNVASGCPVDAIEVKEEEKAA